MWSLQQNEPSFRDCFTDLLLYRSRRILDLSVHGGSGKKRIMKAPGNLMIGYSGGLGSSVLLDLITWTYFTDRSEEFVQRSGVNHPRHTRVWENAYATYIDISAAFEGVSTSFLNAGVALINVLATRPHRESA